MIDRVLEKNLITQNTAECMNSSGNESNTALNIKTGEDAVEECDKFYYLMVKFQMMNSQESIIMQVSTGDNTFL